MLEGAFKDWGGVYDVLLAENNEYLFESKSNKLFRPFCRLLRSKKLGEERCKACDVQATKMADKQRYAIKYNCHVGLKDVAIPIYVDEKLIATVFCGQVRPDDITLDAKSKVLVEYAEQEFGFEQGQLVNQWKEIPQVDDESLDDIINRTETIVNYLARLGKERRELEFALKREKQRTKESKSLEEIANELNVLLETWEEFWHRVARVLNQILETVTASCGLILMEDINRQSENRKATVYAVANLPVDKFEGLKFPTEDVLFTTVLDDGIVQIVPFGHYQSPRTICGTISVTVPAIAANLQDVVLLPINSGTQRLGMLLLFFDKSRVSSSELSVQEELNILRPFTFLLGKAYHNCELFQKQRKEILFRRGWLRRVTHQLIAPLHGLQGYAEDARNRLLKWQEEDTRTFIDRGDDQRWKDELRRWDTTFDAVVWSSHYAARLAQNLAWIVYGKANTIDKEITADFGGFLIACARDFQGIARERNLKRVHVESDAFGCMNGKLAINGDLLRQAIGNLIDNAVKYAKRDTEILINGECVGATAIVRITNYGIQIRDDEVDKIFVEGYRTKDARKSFATGTGIGLPVARDIVQLHSGTLTAYPSKSTNLGWKTILEISLPLRSIEKNRNQKNDQENSLR